MAWMKIVSPLRDRVKDLVLQIGKATMKDNNNHWAARRARRYLKEQFHTGSQTVAAPRRSGLEDIASCRRYCREPRRAKRGGTVRGPIEET